MASGELIILDVGHGNCAIIKHGTTAIVIDAPGRPVVSRVLDELGIKSISALLISHADSDHLSGAIPILLNSERPVQHLYVNPDNRQTDSWRQFRLAAAEARRLMRTSIHSSLNESDPGALSLSGTSLRVLHPSPEMCLATNSGIHTDGNRLDANSMSAVMAVEHEGETLCLLAADSGHHSLDVMIQQKIDLKAAILVFPHHGGNVGGTSDNKEFAKRLVKFVGPQLVIFSLGRGSHGTPRPEIVSGVRESMIASPYIACTQLSKNCSGTVPGGKRIVSEQSEGFKKNHSCSGTIKIPLEKNGFQSILNDLNSNHTSFIINQVPGALCRRPLGSIPISVIAPIP